ncbi:unnamed protein product, partial [Sphacelaria rigidula]
MQQTVKELVDNAVDACRPRVGPPWRRIEDQDPPTVKVVLRRALRSHRSSSNGPIGVDGTEAGSPEEAGDRLELQVVDNGAGLADVTKALLLFSSTKSGHGLRQGSSAGANAGKYGLGMTLSLLYSQATFGSCIKGCLDDMRISVPRGGRECSPHLLLDNQDLVRAFAAGMKSMAEAHKSTATTLGNDLEGTNGCNMQGDSQYSLSHSTQDGERGFRSQPSQGGPCQRETRPERKTIHEEDVAVFECEGRNDTRVSASIALERAPASEALDASYYGISTGETTVPLQVHRFVNGMPMLDTNTSSACALVAGISKAGWRSLGLKISNSRVNQREGKVRFV